MNKTIKIIICIVVLIVVCSAITYVSNPAFFDRFVSDDVQKKWKVERAQKLFPEKIGTHVLFGESSKKVTINMACNKIEDNPILKATGRTGNACMETLNGEYRQTVSSSTDTVISNTVRINLSRFTEAADMLELLVQKSTTPEMLQGELVFRLESQQIGWSPQSMFDLIVTQEALMTISTTTIKAEYSEKASGDNEVTRYFLSKYPPAEPYASATSTAR